MATGIGGVGADLSPSRKREKYRQEGVAAGFLQFSPPSGAPLLSFLVLIILARLVAAVFGDGAGGLRRDVHLNVPFLLCQAGSCPLFVPHLLRYI